MTKTLWLKYAFWGPTNYEKHEPPFLIYGCATTGLSRHHNRPLQWCSAYVPSGRFSSSVTSRPLYDDHHHHSTAERTLTYVPSAVSPRKACNQISRVQNSVPVRFLYFKLGMWRSSNSNSIAVEFRIILPHSTFVECWNCPVIECEFDSVDVRSTDLSHLEFVKDLNVNNFHFESGSQLHCA